MKLDGRFRISAPRAIVFEKLNDPHFFASCLEGVNDLQEIDENNFKAVLETRIAYINFKFDVDVEIRERVAPEKVVVHLQGTPKGMVGRLTSTAVAALIDAAGGRETDIAYEMEVALTGKLGSLGQPVMKSKAKEMERGFVRRASAAFTPQAEVRAQEEPTTAAPSTQRSKQGPGGLRVWFARLLDRIVAKLRPRHAAESAGMPSAPVIAPESSNNKPAVDQSSPPTTLQKSRLDFELARPATLAEALRLLDTEDPTVRPFSGGTGLMLMMKSGVFSPTRLVDLTWLEGEFGAVTNGNGLLIGSLVRLAALGQDKILSAQAPVIARAIPHLANVRVRNAARVGGAIAHGDPHMDLPPILASLGGVVEIEGPQGRRAVPAADLYTGYYQTQLTRGEVITGVRLPSQSGWRSVYRKTTVRTVDDWPALGVAISAKLENGIVNDVRVVVSAATEKVTRVEGVEALLKGVQLDAKFASDAGALAQTLVETVDDVQGSAAYKSTLLEVEVRRALLAVLAEEAVA